MVWGKLKLQVIEANNAILRVLLICLMLVAVPKVVALEGYISNIQANTLYYIENGIPTVTGSNFGLDVIFKDSNGNTVTPSYYWFTTSGYAEGDPRVYAYILFSDSYSTLYVYSRFYEVAYLSKSSYPAYAPGVDAVKTYYAPNGIVLEWYGIIPSSSTVLRSDTNDGYRVKIESGNCIRALKIVNNAETQLAYSCYSSFTIIGAKLVWSDKAYFYAFDAYEENPPTELVTTDQSITRSLPLLRVTGFPYTPYGSVKSIHTTKTYVSTNQAPTINSFSATRNGATAQVSFSVSDNTLLYSVELYRDNVLIWSKYNINKASYSDTITISLPNLPAQVALKVRDWGGHTTWSNTIYVTDDVPPTIDSFTASLSGSTITVSFSVSDDVALGGVGVYKDGYLAWSDTSLSGTTYSKTLTLEATSSSHTITLLVYDKAGNSNSASKNIVDTAIPTINSFSATLSSSGITVSFSVGDDVALSSVTIYRDNIAVWSKTLNEASYSDTITLPLPNSLPTTITLRVVDSSGNLNTASQELKDTIRPGILSFYVTPQPQDKTIMVSFVVGDDISLSYVVIYQDGISVWSRSVSGTEYSNMVVLTYNSLPTTITLKVYDLAGNQASASKEIKDSDAPTINAFSTTISSSGISVSFSVSDDEALVRLEILRDGTVVWSKTLSGKSYTDSVTIGLPSSLPSTVTLKAYDNIGKVSSASKTVTDTKTPAISITSITTTSSGIVVSFSASDDISLKKIEIYRGDVVVWSATVSGTSYSNTVTIPYTTLPVFITAKAYDLANNIAQTQKAVGDTQSPQITEFNVTVSGMSVNVYAVVTDDLALASYNVQIGDKIVNSSSLSGNTATINLTLPLSVLAIGDPTKPPIIYLTVYDAASNFNTVSKEVTIPSCMLTLVDEHRDDVPLFNISFDEIFIEGTDKSKVWIYNSSTPPPEGGSVAFACNVTDTYRIQYLYKDSNDYFFVEIQPWATMYFYPMTIGIPGLINNTSIPIHYQVIFLSTQKIPIVVTTVTGYVKLASTTQHAYDRYYSAEAWLERKMYNVYTIKGGRLHFIASIDGGKAQTVNLDALLSVTELQMKPWILDYEWLDNNTIRVGFQVIDTNVKPIALRVYANNTFLTEISGYTNEISGVIFFDTFNITITNDTRIKLEVLRDGQRVAVKEFIGFREVAFKLPSIVAVGLSLAMLLFGLTLLGIESTIRYFGLMMAFIALAVTSMAEVADFYVRLVQVGAIIFIIVFIIANLRRET